MMAQAANNDIVTCHSEAQILEGCIVLMHELTGYFQEYLEWMGVKPETSEETFSWNPSYFHIVQRLFLWHTDHGGGTSTRLKCRELGVESGESVHFSCGMNEEGEE